MEAPSAGRRNNAAGTVASPSEGAGGALKGPREQRFLVSAAGKWVSSPGRLRCVSNKKSILAGPLGGGWGKRGGSAKVDGAGAGVHGLAPPPTLPGSPGDSAHCPPARAPAPMDRNMGPHAHGAQQRVGTLAELGRGRPVHSGVLLPLMPVPDPGSVLLTF